LTIDSIGSEFDVPNDAKENTIYNLAPSVPTDSILRKMTLVMESFSDDDKQLSTEEKIRMLYTAAWVGMNGRHDVKDLNLQYVGEAPKSVKINFTDYLPKS